MAISLDQLREAVSGQAVGVRARTKLQPLGGEGDKLHPPTYGDGGDPQTKYATEMRRVGEQDVPCVLLDSVASQANRMELALLEAARARDVALPVVSVDFRETAVPSLDRLSSLEAPHRIFDALLRDSLDGEVLFRLGDMGRSITEATSRNATALLRYSPTTLLFGGWDSTGPKGGRGAKYERAITSEVVGIGIERGVKTASRIDPAGIELKAGPVYEAADGTWTLDPADAKQKKGLPMQVSGGGEGGAGRPSQVNHGNIAPSINTDAGGVTIDRAEATTVISFAALRKLRFPLDASGAVIADGERHEAELTARTALAALGLLAAVLAFEEGFDLRSRCVLVADGDLKFEFIARNGSRQSESLDRDDALRLFSGASDALEGIGLGWEADEILLKPTDRLVELIRRSHELAEEAPAVESEE